MKKLFIFADAHSFYDELRSALDKAGFDMDDQDHLIVSLGDLCDRGPQSAEILDFINSLPRERKICIIGNHELLMEEMIRRGRFERYDIFNGTMRTAVDISEDPDDDISALKNNRRWNEYRKCWDWYCEAGDYIFTHGWIPFDMEKRAYDPNWRKASAAVKAEATWVNGMELWSEGIREEGKTIFCGHWNCSWGHCHLHDDGDEFPNENDPDSYARFDPFIDEGIVALDAATAYSHQINVYVAELDQRE